MPKPLSTPIIVAALVLAVTGAVCPAFADEPRVVLKQAPGRAAVLNNCGACHSHDYILMNSPFPDAKLWEAEVTKMIKTFGAPIDDADARQIIDYLKQNYGS